MNILSPDDLALLRSLPEFTKTSGVVALPESIQRVLLETWNLRLTHAPFRWVHGDTLPHVDVGKESFENTYLIYLTDGEGTLTIGDASYPITAGTGFVFPHGTRHSVQDTNGSSRLMLGPMSEQGFAVGGEETAIDADGATTTVYIQQIDSQYYYRLNEEVPVVITLFPIRVTNTNVDPASNILKVLFATNLTITNPTFYLRTNSNGIQFGDTTLRNDGTKYTITVDGIEDYGGFIGNNNGSSDVYVYNLNVEAINGSTLSTDGGWVGRYAYGTNGTNNFIIGCSSNGPISANSGGIVGASAAINSGEGEPELNIIGCTSSGEIASGGGGIAGQYCGQNGGSTVRIIKCSSSGAIGAGAGGIVGQYSGQNDGTCLVQKCYSTGNIQSDAGGIFGQYAGDLGQATATYCYSRGSIATDAGGIFGASAGDTGNATADHCYSSGILATPGNGIFGSGAFATTENSCYVADGSWSTTTATATLGLTNYISVEDNQPFELRAIGPSPYSLTTIVDEDMSLTYSQTVTAGSSSIAGVLDGLSSYSILLINGTSSASTPTVTINGTTGAISTTSETTTATYTILVRALVNPYSITTFVLTVTGGAPPPPTPAAEVPEVRGKGYDFELYTDTQIGKRLVQERLQNPNIRFNSFADYHKYKMALLRNNLR